MKVTNPAYRPVWAHDKPILVVNHFTAVCGSLWPGSGRFGTEGIGSTFGIRRDGTVCQYTDLARSTWHARDCSHYGVGIEFDALPPACPIKAVQLEAGAQLNAWLCKTFSFASDRSPGIDYDPGIKCHTDGLKDGGAKWDSADHWDAPWKATGDPILQWVSGSQALALNSSPWTAATFISRVKEILNPPPPPGGDDELTDAQAAMLDNLDFTAKREAIHHGLSVAPGQPWRENLAKIRAAAARKTLEVPAGQPTPVPPTVP